MKRKQRFKTIKGKRFKLSADGTWWQPVGMPQLVYAGSFQGGHGERISLSLEDMFGIAKKAGLFVHDADLNHIRTIGGPKRCHNPKCRCQQRSRKGGA